MTTKRINASIIIIISILACFASLAHGVDKKCKVKHKVKDKVAVIITSWGSPAGYNFEYAWNSHSWCRVGDRTEYPGQPCKEDHVGVFPYSSHLGFLPWAQAWNMPGYENVFDNSGIYQLVDDMYIPMDPTLPSILPETIPSTIPIVPVREVINAMTGELGWPVDPRDGTDHLAGWYKIGSRSFPYPNGSGDLYEQGPLGFLRRFGILGGPTEPPDAYLEDERVLQIGDYTKHMLEQSFGNRIDVRFGSYGRITGYTPHEIDTAENFANEGFRKMLIARETTDNNHYANKYMSGGYIREKLCEMGVLDEFEIYQTRQVGRTPEFNALNVINMKPFIEQYPEDSTIGIIYVTRGLPWGVQTSSQIMGSQHPWANEVYHENAYLNYLSWKEAMQKAYGDRYHLVFTRGDSESNLMRDNFFTYGMSSTKELGGHFYSIRQAIQFAKEDGIDKIIIAPCHWLYDCADNLINMREMNNLPLVPRADLDAGIYDLTYCENEEGSEVPCDSTDAEAKITIAPSYSNYTDKFAKSYYVVLRGTLERFGLFPKKANIKVQASAMITKLSGGIVKVTNSASPIKGAKIAIPPDPYPDRPEFFTPQNAIPINDPADTNDALWEDTVINIGYQDDKDICDAMKKYAEPIGMPVYFGPYRTISNRDFTITIPYTKKIKNTAKVSAYIYNDLTRDWDGIPVASIDQKNKQITFKTQVLGLFTVAELKEKGGKGHCCPK